MIEDMTLAVLPAGTQATHIDARNLAGHYGRSPDQLTEENREPVPLQWACVAQSAGRECPLRRVQACTDFAVVPFQKVRVEDTDGAIRRDLT